MFKTTEMQISLGGKRLAADREKALRKNISRPR